MLLAFASNVEVFGYFVQSTPETLAAPHQEFDIVNAREPSLQEIEEFGFGNGHVDEGDHLEDIAKVVPRVEADPLDVFEQNETRRDEKFAEILGIDSLFLVSLEIEPRCLQKFDGVRRIHIVIEVEAKVELPNAFPFGLSPILITQCESELNDLQEVDVATQGLIMIIRRGFESADRSSNDPREFGIHSDVWIILYKVPDDSHFTVQIISPNIADLEPVHLIYVW